MLLDTQNLFSDNQAITTGTINSTNVVRFGKGDISYVPIIIQVTKSFTNLTSLTVKIQTSADSTFATAVDLAQSTMLLADLTAGAVFPLTYLPKGNKGYIRLTYTGAGTTETTGTITAGVVAGLDREIKEI